MIGLVVEQGNKNEVRFSVEAYKGFRLLLTHPYETGTAIIGLLEKMIEAGFTPNPIGDIPSMNTEVKETRESKEKDGGRSDILIFL